MREKKDKREWRPVIHLMTLNKPLKKIHRLELMIEKMVNKAKK